jgi:hypothetical protein
MATSNISESIEFHDSTLTSVTFLKASVDPELRAYVAVWRREFVRTPPHGFTAASAPS